MYDDELNEVILFPTLFLVIIIIDDGKWGSWFKAHPNHLLEPTLESDDTIHFVYISAVFINIMIVICVSAPT